MGCLETVTEISVVRLTYEKNIATARVLEPKYLKTLMFDPLLRSTDALRALFNRVAVITEGDTDRAFYDEMNKRLQSENRGIKDVLFLNAQNAQTIHRLIDRYLVLENHGSVNVDAMLTLRWASQYTAVMTRFLRIIGVINIIVGIAFVVFRRKNHE